MDLSVVILAGGVSSRFGRNKALESIDGRTSLERVISVASTFGSIWLVGGSDDRHPMCAGVIKDIEPKGGPFQAFISALRRLGPANVLLLSCDVPFVPSEVLGHLGRPLEQGVDARIVRLHGRAQYLLAHYGPGAHDKLVDAYDSGVRSMHKAIEALAVQWVEDHELIEIGAQLHQLQDFDTEDDLRGLKTFNLDS